MRPTTTRWGRDEGGAERTGRGRSRGGGRRWARWGGVALAGVVALPVFASAQEFKELSRDQEVRLAMSAGPLNVSKDADVWLFGDEGFEKAIEGTNGYACMVIRSASDPEILAPHCFSPDAVESVVPAKVAESRMQREGRSAEEIDAALREAMSSGRLPLPSGDAFAYMMSSGQNLGPAGRWRPHFMLYMPYATNETVGGTPGTPAYPFVGPDQDHPHSTLVIVMTEFVDPADVVPPR